MTEATRMAAHMIIDERIENDDFAKSLPKHYANPGTSLEEWAKGNAMFITENWDEIWESREQYEVYMKVLGQAFLRYLIGSANAKALMEEVKHRDQG